MKKMTSYIMAMLCVVAATAVSTLAAMPVPENPATGIWIQQVGDIVPHGSSRATLYYTKYEYDKSGDRVKGISYTYNGAGYLLMKPSDKRTVCYQGDGIEGADGIVEHPDGDLLIAGQGNRIFKVNKSVGGGTNKCLVKRAATAKNQHPTSGFWHLMMDPSQKTLWAAGIPGPLFRFSTEMNGSVDKNFASEGYYVALKPDSRNRRKDSTLATIIWDGDRTAFFTYSDYYGGGCESNGGKSACDAANQVKKSAGAYFGYFKDTTKVLVTSKNKATYGGNVGDSVITAFGTKILIDSLEGAHGGTYDPYSQTIFVFGGSKIVQIKPLYTGDAISAKVVATIDLRTYFFEENSANLTGPRTPGVGWRLDQGTVDGYGHLFVASNTGHMIFVDYASNPQKLINDNVLIHVQWIDNYLDDVAPLKGVIVDRDSASIGDDGDLDSTLTGSSSSLVVYEESSSSKYSSSSNTNSSSSDNSSKSSSSGTPGLSSSSTGGDPSSSNGSTPGSSAGTGTSSAGEGISSSGGAPGVSSSGTGEDPSSSNGSIPGSSAGTGMSSAGEGVSSSGGAPGVSSSGTGDDPSSSNGSTSGSSDSNNGSSNSNSGSNSSSSRGIGAGDDVEDKSSSSRLYYGADDYEEDDGSGFDRYPSADDFERGDSIVAEVVILDPAKPGSTKPGIEINGNSYVLSDKPSGEKMYFNYDSGKLDSAKVGQIVAVTLDPDKVQKYFGGADSLTLKAESSIKLVNPATGAKQDSIVVNADGSVTFFVTADEAVRGGSIKIYGGNDMVIIDNINFYDPIPDSRVAYIKDSDGDKTLDYVEILLKEPLSMSYDLGSVSLAFNGTTVKCTNPKLNESRDRILVSVGNLELPDAGKFPKDGKAIVSYVDAGDSKSTYQREAPIVEVGNFVIKDAFAIRNATGMDSLFLQFNIDLIPVDIGTPELLVLLKQAKPFCKKPDSDGRCAFDIDQVKKVYMPAKNILILVAKDFGLNGKMKDSVSLYPGVTFNSLPYITSDEYDREIPVTVVDRFPSAKSVEYWDTDEDGVLDQIVTVFDKKLTSASIDSSLYMSFPWYSSNNRLIQLQAQPSDLMIDPKDSTRVIWNVHSATKLISGVTNIRDDLPEATIYTYYSVFDETFVNEETAPLVDKMSPIVAKATLSYGSKADTLVVEFSEPIMTKGLDGKDFFSYIHGKEIIDIDPKDLSWSADGLSATLVVDGSSFMIMPGDSLLVKKGKHDKIRDNFGNVAGEDPQPVIIGGLLNHLVESTNMGTFDADDDRVIEDRDDKSYTLQTVSSVNLRYLPGSTTKEDMEKEGALGQLVQLGERFVPQLLDRAQIAADGSYDPSVLDSLKPEDVYISFIVNYFDNLGQYVNDSIITVPCNSPKFGGNCLATDKKVFVNWNFKDHKGRFVGTGVYNVQFKMIVRYENKKIEEEIKDKWGVRRKKSKHRK